MTRPIRFVLTIMVIAVVVWILYGTAQRLYFTPMKEKRAEIVDLESKVEERASTNRAVFRRRLQDIANQTLGSDRQTVDHRFRTRLNRITEQLGLNGAAVSTAGTSAKRSPARTNFSRRGMQGELRAMIDFIELEGWVNAEGSLEQVLALVDRIEAEPWLKRIDQVKFDAKDEGSRCAVSIRLTTLMMPDYAPTQTRESNQYDRRRLDRFAGLLESNPFAVERPPQEPEPTRVAEQTNPHPPEEPTFPYGQWAVTGTAMGPDGVEVWLLHRDNGETRRLLVGQEIGEARLLAAEGENARFELDQRQFLVSIGGTLADAKAVDR